MPEQINKAIKQDRLNSMQMLQLKITPLNKQKIVVPMSLNRLQTPSNTHNLANVSLIVFYFLKCFVWIFDVPFDFSMQKL